MGNTCKLPCACNESRVTYKEYSLTQDDNPLQTLPKSFNMSESISPIRDTNNYLGTDNTAQNTVDKSTIEKPKLSEAIWRDIVNNVKIEDVAENLPEGKEVKVGNIINLNAGRRILGSKNAVLTTTCLSLDN